MAGLEELKRRLRPLSFDAAGGLREVRISLRVLKCALSFRNGFGEPQVEFGFAVLGNGVNDKKGILVGVVVVVQYNIKAKLIVCISKNFSKIYSKFFGYFLKSTL
jgi:hypothetical protein